MAQLTAPIAPAANPTANARTTSNKQTTPNASGTGQAGQFTVNSASAPQAGIGTQGSSAPSTDQTSVVREMALAAAAERLAPSTTMRSGEVAPDLAVFRETNDLKRVVSYIVDESASGVLDVRVD